MNPIFQNMLSRYSARTKDERRNATHEVMQQITLAGLYKAGFFNHAAFYGSIVPAGQTMSAHSSKINRRWTFGVRIIFYSLLK